VPAFPTPGHLASWAGLAPKSRVSAGRAKPRRPAKGNRHPGPDYYKRRQDTRKQAPGHVERLERPGFQVTSPHPRRQPSDGCLSTTRPAPAANNPWG